MNLRANQTLPIYPSALLAVRCDAWLGGIFAGIPHAKGGTYEEELSSREQTEPSQPNSLGAPVTMYDSERMAGLNAMPPNAEVSGPPNCGVNRDSGTECANGGSLH